MIRDSAVDLPGGLDAWTVRGELRQRAEATQADVVRRNLVLDGPLIVSSPALPWADEARAIALEAFEMFIARSHYVGGGLAAMEDELLAFVAVHLGLDQAHGVVTTGGTESNFLALVAAVEAAGHRGSVVVPRHAHASVWKACRVLGLEAVPIEGPLGEVSEEALRAALRPDTIAMVANAGSIPLGVVDPIPMMAAVALEHDVFLHVDASVGGWLFPFAPERFAALGVPAWDFSVPGVRSVSACPHKHGWSPVGAGALLYRDPADDARMRAVAPPAGTLSGIRSGGPTAAAWAMVRCLGHAGYAQTTHLVLDLAAELDRAVEEVEGVAVDPRSVVNVRHLLFADAAPDRVRAGLATRGWATTASAVPDPGSLLVWLSPQNHGRVGELVADLAACLAGGPAADGAAVPTDHYADLTHGLGPAHPPTEGADATWTQA